MSREEVQGKTTLALMKEYVENSQELRKYQGVQPEDKKHWWQKKWLDWRKRSLYQKIRRIGVELAARYEGIFHQLLRKSGVDSTAIKPTISAIWVSCQDRLLTLNESKRFSQVLWESYVSIVGAEINGLKPKFMLRQFIDEMPSSDERGILMDRAYDKNAINQDSGAEVLNKLTNSYPILHEQLIRHGKDLRILTDREITQVVVSSIKPPFVQYEQWLFPN